MRRTTDAGLRPLVLVHGFTGSAAVWGPDLLHRLGEGGRPVVTMQLPGHGATALAATDSLARDARHGRLLAAALARIEAAAAEADPEGGRFHLVGYSMGGRIALHFAARSGGRLASLTLESASPGLADPAARAARGSEDQRLAARIEREGVEAFARAWERRPLFRGEEPPPEETRKRLAGARRAHEASGLAAALRGLGTGALPSLWGRLGTLDVPTLLLVGALDTKFVGVARRMARALPRAAVRVVEGAGHIVHVDRPAAWTSAVLEHLRATEAGGSDEAF